MFVDVGFESSEKPSMFERMEGIEMDFREELGTAFKSDDRDEADVEDVDEDEAEEEDDDDVCWADPPPR